MNETDRNEHAAPPPSPDLPHADRDSDALIERLRAAGAERFDPVRWCYIEALSRRAMTQQGSARRIIEARLAQALTALEESFEMARRHAGEIAARTAEQFPHAAGDLQRCLDAGDFKGVRRLVAGQNAAEDRLSLGALVRQLEQVSADNGTNADTRIAGTAGSRPELKAIRNFRNTWSKLSADKQVLQALEQAPKNAGPINSHMLVLRSLAMMRDISPDYLNRFMSYADALLCLDECETGRLGNVKKAQASRTARK